ncbi:MAG: NUDIX hydrolase [Acidimicrobiales bacterium]
MTEPPGVPGAKQRPEVAVGTLCLDGGRLLLVRRAQAPHAGLWSVPGGRVEWGEALIEAARRETLEETGLDVRCADMAGWVERIDAGFHFVILDFWAQCTDPARTPVPGSDVDAVAWIPTDELDACELVPGLRRFLRSQGI